MQEKDQRYLNEDEPEAKQLYTKIAADTDFIKAGWHIFSLLRQQDKVELQVMGKEAVYITCKAIIAARGNLLAYGADLYFYPEFVTVEIDGEKRSALRFVVERVKPEE
ncbi:MAG: stage V sporulation protein S [Patescibacteria group bacterium]|jgi:stage V sporulation protein S